MGGAHRYRGPPLPPPASGNGQNISGQRVLSEVIPLQCGVPIKGGLRRDHRRRWP